MKWNGSSIEKEWGLLIKKGVLCRVTQSCESRVTWFGSAGSRRTPFSVDRILYFFVCKISKPTRTTLHYWGHYEVMWSCLSVFHYLLWMRLHFRKLEGKAETPTSHPLSSILWRTVYVVTMQSQSLDLSTVTIGSTHTFTLLGEIDWEGIS